MAVNIFATRHITRAQSHVILQVHHARRGLFRTHKEYSKSGSAIEIGDNDFILDEAFSPKYNLSKDVIIRNYSSAITAKNIEHLGYDLYSIIPIEKHTLCFIGFQPPGLKTWKTLGFWQF